MKVKDVTGWSNTFPVSTTTHFSQGLRNERNLGPNGWPNLLFVAVTRGEGEDDRMLLCRSATHP
jgi:hypothetical protein